MVYRYSWLAGFAGIAFAFLLLNSLLRDTIEGPPWQLVVLAGLVLGTIITWTALSYRARPWIVVVANAAAMLIAVVRVATPETTFLFLPTGASFSELRLQLDQAFEIIRNGVEPVLPVSGLVIIVTAVFWVVGAVLVWSLMQGHPYVGLIPPLVLSLQFATMDRNPSGLGATALFLALVGGTMLAVNADERDRGAGRMARRGAWPSSRNRLAPSALALLGTTLLASVLATGTLRAAVPPDGVVDWRSSTGLTGDFFGSISYNPFIGIQQSLVSQTEADVFVARVDGDVDPSRLYFRLLTMETYNGGQFYADKPEVLAIDEPPLEAPGQAFAGDVDPVTTSITITRLRMDWLPAAYVPVGIEGNRSVTASVRARTADGSLRFDGGRSYDGMRYTVRSLVPRPDLTVLAAGPDGNPSPVFQAAVDDPETDNSLPELTPPPAVREEPVDPERYLDLPEDLDPGIGALARSVTANLTTPFEKALALEAFLRDPEKFRYNARIEAGHGATDLADWLLDPSSPNWRTGYCEQFATSMAVMARTLGVHSRVVLGFTPGDVLDDGRVVVRDKNAHAWVELWMPTQGWVRFDPTPRSDGVNPTTFDDVRLELGFDVRPYLDLPDPDVPSPGVPPILPLPGLDPPELPGFIGAGGGSEEGGGVSLPGWLSIVLPALGIVVLLLGLVPGLKWFRRRRRMRRLEKGDISAAWEEIVTRLIDLGEQPNRTLTPTELADKVDTAMEPLAVVYTRSVYGPSGSIGTLHIEAATTSLQNTAASFTTRYSTGRRLLAWYRPATLVPAWVKRWRQRRRER